MTAFATAVTLSGHDGPPPRALPSPFAMCQLRLTPPVLLLAGCLSLAAGPVTAWAEDVVSVPLTATATSQEPAKRADAGVFVGLPATLGTGLAGGVGLGVLHPGSLTWGLRAAYVQATEYTTTWATTHHEIRLRAVGVLQRTLGRAGVGLRLGLGATVLYESRVRAQAARLGDLASSLNTSAWAGLPGAELEAFVALPIVGPVGLALSAGPSVHLFQGGPTPGWLAQLTAVWWP